MDLEKELLLASMYAVLCKIRDVYRSRRRPCRAIPYYIPVCTYIFRESVSHMKIVVWRFVHWAIELHVAMVG